MKPERTTYQKLLNFALETDIGFALLIVQCDNYDMQTKWRNRLDLDLDLRGVKLVAIEGVALPVHAGVEGIARDIEKFIPESGPYVISLSHLEIQSRKFAIPLSDEERSVSSDIEFRPSPLITRLNVERDTLVKSFPVPFIVWFSKATVRQLAEFAPDFYDIRDSILNLPVPESPYTELKLKGIITPNVFIDTHVELPEETVKRLEEDASILRRSEKSLTAADHRNLMTIITDLAASRSDVSHRVRLFQEAYERALNMDLKSQAAYLQRQLARCYAEMSEWKKSSDYYASSIDSYRTLAKNSPGVYQIELARTLNEWGNLLVKTGERSRAKKIYNEAITIASCLAERQPEAGLSLEAEIINNYALLLKNLGERREAMALYEKCISLYRKLAKENPPLYGSFLVGALNNYSTLLSFFNKNESAWAFYEEALQLERSLKENKKTYTDKVNVYDIFISHFGNCESWVDALANNLANRGYRIYLDRQRKLAPEEFFSEYDEGLRQSRKAILVATQQVIDSGWIRKEYERMMDIKHGEPEFAVIPVVLGEDAEAFPFLDDIRWVDFRNKNAYQKSFYDLVCALENIVPGLGDAFDVKPGTPDLCEKKNRFIYFGERSLSEEFRELFRQNSVVVLLARMGQEQATMKKILLQHMETRFGNGNALQLNLPYGRRFESGNFFYALSRQFNFSKPAGCLADFLKAFEALLSSGDPMYVQISGFEHTNKSASEEIAAVLRSLTEGFENLRVLCVGGRQLLDLFYFGTLSYLSSARAVNWPEMTADDVYNILKRLHPDQMIDKKIAGELLRLCGGHLELLRQSLKFYIPNKPFDPIACEKSLIKSPSVWKLFLPLVQDTDTRLNLYKLLDQKDLGPFLPFFYDPLLDSLYWHNFIKRKKDRTIWRCESIVEAGRLILGESEK